MTKKEISFLFSTCFKIGYISKFPGTVTSFFAVIFSFFLCYFFGILGVTFFTILCLFIGFFSIKETLKYTKHDPSFIVLDEVIGQVITFIFCSNFLENNFSYTVLFIYLLGFLLFRIFDIFKKGPIKWIDENIKNVYGVILDDVLAGFFSAIILFLIKLIFFE